ncbi:MAG: hypothetical protein WAK97_12170, partial [Pseudolabrys sp.]
MTETEAKNQWDNFTNGQWEAMGHPREIGHDKRLILRLRDSPPLGRHQHTSRLIEQSLRKHFAVVHESAVGTKRTSLFAPHMSAFRGKADITISFAEH